MLNLPEKKLIKDSVPRTPGRQTVGAAARGESGCHLLELRTSYSAQAGAFPEALGHEKAKKTKARTKAHRIRPSHQGL